MNVVWYTGISIHYWTGDISSDWWTTLVELQSGSWWWIFVAHNMETENIKMWIRMKWTGQGEREREREGERGERESFLWTISCHCLCLPYTLQNDNFHHHHLTKSQESVRICNRSFADNVIDCDDQILPWPYNTVVKDRLFKEKGQIQDVWLATEFDLWYPQFDHRNVNIPNIMTWVFYFLNISNDYGITKFV